MANDADPVDGNEVKEQTRRLTWHGQSPLLRVVAGQRHPSNVERVGEGTKRLGPDNAKVTHASLVRQLGEGAVENVAEQVHAEAGHDGLAAAVA